MTMREAAQEIGMGDSPQAARRLGYLIRKREAEIGKRIMIGGGQGRANKVTVAALRRHFDDLVDDQSYFARIVSEAVDEIREDMLELRGRLKALAAEFRKLKKLTR
jgi:hypothetical protein